jgi:hypothetical protein
MEKLQRIQNMTVTVQIRFGKKEKYPFFWLEVVFGPMDTELTPRRGRAWSAAGFATAGVALLAAVALLVRGGSAPNTVRSIDSEQSAFSSSSYQTEVFNDNGLAAAGANLNRLARRHAAAGDTFNSEVFPKYGAFMNCGDDSGSGQSMLRKAQNEANRWLKKEKEEWTGRV